MDKECEYALQMYVHMQVANKQMKEQSSTSLQAIKEMHVKTTI